MQTRTPTNKELSEFMGRAWNGWFVKWRDRAASMSDFEWGDCVDELDEIIAPVCDCAVAVEIARALMFELERRREGAGGSSCMISSLLAKEGHELRGCWA